MGNLLNLSFSRAGFRPFALTASLQILAGMSLARGNDYYNILRYSSLSAEIDASRPAGNVLGSFRQANMVLSGFQFLLQSPDHMLLLWLSVLEITVLRSEGKRSRIRDLQT